MSDTTRLLAAGEINGPLSVTLVSVSVRTMTESSQISAFLESTVYIELASTLNEFR
jgi:hypothetical protein